MNKLIIFKLIRNWRPMINNGSFSVVSIFKKLKRNLIWWSELLFLITESIAAIIL